MSTQGFFGSIPQDTRPGALQPFSSGASSQFVDLFEETNPFALLSARTNQLNPNFGQRSQVNNLFGRLFEQYQGLLAQQALGGQVPQGSFNEFLGGGLPGFGGLEQFLGGISPEQRGLSQARFNPRTSFLQ